MEDARQALRFLPRCRNEINPPTPNKMPMASSTGGGMDEDSQAANRQSHRHLGEQGKGDQGQFVQCQPFRGYLSNECGGRISSRLETVFCTGIIHPRMWFDDQVRLSA